MTQDELIKLTKGREKRTLEYKTAWSDVPENVFETVCAFLNRDGGVIVLGALDDGTILDGVNPKAAEQMCKNIANMSNNREKLNPQFPYTKLYTGHEPLLDDEDLYKTTIPLPPEMDAVVLQTRTYKEVQKKVQKNHLNVTGRQVDVMVRMLINPNVTKVQIAEDLSVTVKNVSDDVSALKALGVLLRKGGRKEGEWVVNLEDRN